MRAACRWLAGAGLVAVLAAGCSTAQESGGTACTDLQTPGFDPVLERLLPSRVSGMPVARVESGRSCSAEALGSLANAGIHELRFAGAVARYSGDQSTGLTVSVYRAPGLTLDRLADVFATGAGTSRSVSGVRASPAAIADQSGIRIDAIAEGQQETVFVWPAGAPDTFDAVIAIGATDADLRAAVQAFGGAAAAPSG